MKKQRILSKYKTRSTEEVLDRALTKLRRALVMRGIRSMSDIF
jgi:hypothetical protein